MEKIKADPAMYEEYLESRRYGNAEKWEDCHVIINMVRAAKGVELRPNDNPYRVVSE